MEVEQRNYVNIKEKQNYEAPPTAPAQLNDASGHFWPSRLRQISPALDYISYLKEQGEENKIRTNADVQHIHPTFQPQAFP